MTTISATMVKQLREKTGAGMMDCKQALVECDADIDKAVDFLRKKGLATAQKRAGRAMTEGTVQSYIHMGGKLGVLVEVNCETDFVAKNEDFLNFTKNIAMHIAAVNPQHVEESDVPSETVEKEKAILIAQAESSGKPPEIIEKMIMGRLKKFLGEITLVGQPFVKDPDQTVGKLLSSANARVNGFQRFEVGEGIEKKQEDFAAEVMAQVKG